MKKILSMISVVLAMGLMLMSPAAATDTEPNSGFMLSFEALATDMAISIDDNWVVKPSTSNLITEKPMEKQNFVAVQRDTPAFSGVKGGGFSLIHGSKTSSY